MRNTIFTFVLVILISAVSAEVSQVINFQGRLTDSEGPVTSTVSMTFTVYDAETGGNSRWTETHPSVSVTDGLFSAFLGSYASLPDSLFGAGPNWLGITVGSDDEITPRSLLGSVPSAFRVGSIEGASGGNLTDSLIVNGSITSLSGGIRFPDGTVQFTQAGASNGLPEAGGTMTGPIVSVGNPEIQMGKGNFGSGNSNTGLNSFVAGENNDASGDYSVVAGGSGNIADGIGGASGKRSTGWSAVVGGYQNHAHGKESFIGAGELNYAEGIRSVIGGGLYDTALGEASTVTGGWNNKAVSNYCFVGGGQSNNAAGGASVVAGGGNNNANGSYSSIAGGSSNDANGGYSSIGGGESNQVSNTGHWSVVGGGKTNNVDANYGTIAGGQSNEVSGQQGTIAGGYANDVLTENNGTIGGGSFNVVEGMYATISGGHMNEARATAATVAGGRLNRATGPYSAILGGENNYVDVEGPYATIGGGKNNGVDGEYSSILGGYENYIAPSADYSYLFGIQDTLYTDSTFMVNMPNIWIGHRSNGYQLPNVAGELNQVLSLSQDIGSNRILTWYDAEDLSGWVRTFPIVHTQIDVESVGIGTSTPTEKLEVAGVVYSTSGGFKFPDGTIQTSSASGDNDWTLSNNVLNTGGEWSIARSGNTLHSGVNMNTHINLGINCTTGRPGWNHSNCTVGGGIENTAWGFATVSGGGYNTAMAGSSTIGGGQYNFVEGDFSAISGGYADTITSTADYSYLFGIASKLTQDSTFMVDMPHIRFGDEVSGYEFPESDGATGQVMVTDGSGQLTWTNQSGGGENWSLVSEVVYTSGEYGVARQGATLHGLNDSTHINLGISSTTGTSGQDHKYATVGGGLMNKATMPYSVVAGGGYNTAGGSNYSTIGGGASNEISAGMYATISGGRTNNISSIYQDVTIGGGGLNNITSGSGGTIAGGRENTIAGSYGTISGGFQNDISSAHYYNTICGGWDNSITSNYGSTIAGGVYNRVDAGYGTIAGGDSNYIANSHGAIGGGKYNSIESHYGAIPGGLRDTLGPAANYSMVFGADVYLNSGSQVAFFDGGSWGRLGVNRDDHDGGIDYPIHVGTNTNNGNGAHLTAGGTWTNSSSRDFKDSREPVDGSVLLDRIAGLTLESWQYRDSDERHIGPYAEDFVAAFDVGTVDEEGNRQQKYLAPSDVAGVALAGVKELYIRNQELETEVAQLKALVEQLLSQNR
jgi:hypothetical protein